MSVWNSLQNTANEALNLPKGSFAADFGFLVEQSVSPGMVIEAVTELREKQIDITVASQSGILVKAKEEGLLEDWAELVLL